MITSRACHVALVSLMVLSCMVVATHARAQPQPRSTMVLSSSVVPLLD